jgi:hypothetical protein
MGIPLRQEKAAKALILGGPKCLFSGAKRPKLTKVVSAKKNNFKKKVKKKAKTKGKMRYHSRKWGEKKTRNFIMVKKTDPKTPKTPSF